MRALILNSGTGSRMGELTKDKHKSMVEIKEGLPLIVYQIETIAASGIDDFIITTGAMSEKLIHCIHHYFGNRYRFEFVYNDKYNVTNYIYSIYLALSYLDDDVLLLHGDLYFTRPMLAQMLAAKESCVVVDTTLKQPEKDFKAHIEGEKVTQIATCIFGANCYACQPLYKLLRADWRIWADAIAAFCAAGKTGVYAEEALNTILDRFALKPFDVKGGLCTEIDTPEDLSVLKKRLEYE